MKIKKVLMMFTALILSVCLLAGCAPGFVNPGDNLGGGGTVSSAPQESSSEYSSEISAAVSSDAVASEATEVPEGATDRKSTRLNSSHRSLSRMPSSA